MTGTRDAPCRLLLSAAVIGGCLLVLTVDQPYLGGLASTFLQKLDGQLPAPSRGGVAIRNGAPPAKKRRRQRPPAAGSALDQWADFAQGMDEETRKVQELISANQNPEDCESRRFLMWKNQQHGIGSDLHYLGWALGKALEQNRTLVYNPDSRWLFAPMDECGRYMTSPDCYVAPLSSCQYVARRLADEAGGTWRDDDDYGGQGVASREEQKVLHLSLKRDVFACGSVPKLEGSGLWAGKGVSWWRAQMTRYTLRFTAETKGWIREHFKSQLARYPASSHAEQQQGWDLAVSSPPPEQAICMHIRHGDKAREMRLHPFEDYLASAERLVQEEGAPRHVFLATDDDSVITSIESGLYNDSGFTFYYSRAGKSGDLGPEKAAAVLGPAYLARTTFADLSLLTHPSCQWFVLTTASNFGRLVNEVRVTDGLERQEATLIDLEPAECRRRQRGLGGRGEASASPAV